MMERRVALAAAFAGTITMAIGALSYAAIGGVDILGFSGAGGGYAADGTPVVVEQIENVDHVVVIPSPTTVAPIVDAPAQSPAKPAAPSWYPSNQAPAAASAAESPTTAAPTSAPAAPPTTAAAATPKATTPPATSPPAVTPSAALPAPTSPATTSPPVTSSPATSPPTTKAPSTTVPATGTTLPAGAQVPSDWPTNTPIPPIPAGCRKPVLEDNGVWNCEH